MGSRLSDRLSSAASGQASGSGFLASGSGSCERFQRTAQIQIQVTDLASVERLWFGYLSRVHPLDNIGSRETVVDGRMPFVVTGTMLLFKVKLLMNVI